MTVTFMLLGTVEAAADGRQLDLGHARQRSVLAVLLAEANRVVPTGDLADRVWGNRSPQRHRNTLHSYLSRIRQALEAARDAGGDATLERQPGGYCLTVDPDSVDLHRFTALLARARASGTDEEAAALFEEALGLWRGEALAGLDTPWFGALRDALHQQRFAAELDRNDALLRCGRHGPLLPGLTADARANPLDERLAGQLMLALHRCGRPADALAYYRELRSRLRGELGMEPSPPLRELQHRILVADPGLTVLPRPLTETGAGTGGGAGTGSGTGARTGSGAGTRIGSGAGSGSGSGSGTGGGSASGSGSEAGDGSGSGSGSGSGVETGAGAEAGPGSGPGAGAGPRNPPPRQLPAPPPLFTGRDGELAALTAALVPPPAAGEPAGPPAALAIGVIGGIGGVGKTWLAVRWAHDHLDRFPDGQLYVNLRGFDPAAPPVPPATAIRQMLDALHVRPASVPQDPEALAGFYRGLLADRRMLILLDNARDTEQVRPLLPGGTGCTVLVTSRNRLGSLVTAHGARVLPLGSLAAPEARALLTRHLGPQRVTAEPDAVSALLEHCSGLPLALGVVAARATAHPGFPLAGLAEELRESADRLDALGDTDLTADLRAVFSSSYHALGREAARLYALLGLVPGPDWGVYAAASLAATAPARTRVHLRELEAAHLVEQHAPGRYRMHDLVRLHAAECGNRDGADETGAAGATGGTGGTGEPDDSRDAAVRRLVDFHLHTGLAANRLLDGVNTPFAPEPGPPAPGCAPVPLADTAEAVAWLEAEHPGIRGSQLLALEQGRHALVWQLAWTLIPFHWGGGRFREHLDVWRTALTAAERAGNPLAEALAHWRLGQACSHLGRGPEAFRHLRRALTLCERSADTAGRAHVHRTLGWVSEQQGDEQGALAHALRALKLYRRLGNTGWLAGQLNAVGWCHAQLGLHEEALAHCEEALALFRKADGDAGTASTLDSLGYIAHRMGRPADAVGYYREALTLFRNTGNVYDEADTLAHLGDAQEALGLHAEARTAHREALALYRAQRRSEEARRMADRLEGGRERGSGPDAEPGSVRESGSGSDPEPGLGPDAEPGLEPSPDRDPDPEPDSDPQPGQH